MGGQDDTAVDDDREFVVAALEAMSAAELSEASASFRWNEQDIMLLRGEVGVRKLNPNRMQNMGRALKPVVRRLGLEQRHTLANILTKMPHDYLHARGCCPERDVSITALREVTDELVEQYGAALVRLMFAHAAGRDFISSDKAAALLLTDERLRLPEWETWEVPDIDEDAGEDPLAEAEAAATDWISCGEVWDRHLEDLEELGADAAVAVALVTEAIHDRRRVPAAELDKVITYAGRYARVHDRFVEVAADADLDVAAPEDLEQLRQGVTALRASWEVNEELAEQLVALRRLAAVEGPDDEQALVTALRADARRLVDDAGEWDADAEALVDAYVEFGELVEAGARGDHATARNISKQLRGRLPDVAAELIVSAATGYLQLPSADDLTDELDDESTDELADERTDDGTGDAGQDEAAAGQGDAPEIPEPAHAEEVTSPAAEQEPAAAAPADTAAADATADDATADAGGDEEAAGEERDAGEGEGTDGAVTGAEPVAAEAQIPDERDPSTGQGRDEAPDAPAGEPKRATSADADDGEVMTPPAIDLWEDADDETVPAPAEEEVAAVVADLVNDRRFGLAYWAAEAGRWAPPRRQVLEAVAYADAMRSATGSCAALYGVAVNGFSLSGLEANRGLQLLALAAAVRASLVAPFSGSGDVLRELEHAIDDPSLRHIIEDVLVAESAGIRLAADTLSHVRDRAELEAAADEAITAAADAAEKWPLRTSPYQRSTAVWRRWLGEDELLGELLAIAAADERDRRDHVSRTVVELRDPRRVNDLLDATDLDMHGINAVKNNEIGSPARPWVLRSVAELLDVVDAWVRTTGALDDADSGAEAWREKRLNKLRGPVRRHGDAALERLRTEADPDRPLVAAAATKAADLLAETFALLLDGTPLPGAEPSADVALGGELLRATGLPLAGLVPAEGAQVTLDHVSTAAATSWTDAFNARLEEGNHEATAAILGALADAGADTDTIARLATRRRDALESDRAALARKHARCTTALAAARRQRHLSDDEASEMGRRLDELAPGQAVVDFPAAQACFEQFLEELGVYRTVATEEFAAELDAARTADARVDAEADRLAKLAGEGDLDTAREFLAMLRAGQDLPTARIGAGRLRRFHPSFVSAVATGPPPVRTIVDAIRKRTDVGPASFAELSDDAADRANRAMQAWTTLTRKEARTEADRELPAVLALLGLDVETRGVTRARDVKGGSNRMWLDVRGARPIGVPLPVYQFGSKAAGSYRVLLCWSRPTEDMVLEWVREDTSRRPIIVAYFGVLDTNARWQLARALRTDAAHLDVIVVDDAVMLNAAADGTGTFGRTLEITLPFTGINPYVPFGFGNIPEEMFFGRREERESIQDPFGTLFIYGGRQLGKSALMRAAEREFTRRGPAKRAAYVDLRARGIGVNRPADAVIDFVIEALTDLGVPLQMPRTPAERADALVRQTREWLTDDPDRAILLLLDEADAFLDIDAPLFRNVSILKELLETTDRAFKPVFAGLHQVQRFMSVPNQPLAHLGKHIQIGPLTPQAAFELATEPLLALGYEFESEELAARLLNHTNYQPGIIQLFGHALVAHMLAGTTPRNAPPYRITDADVEAVHADAELLDAIRDRFHLTLSLDARYRVIAYTMAHAVVSGGASTMTTEQLREQCQFWWPTGFASLSPNEFKGLVDEMVGLGVLAPTPGAKRTYGMRSPNVLRLLGDAADIETDLLDAYQLTLQRRFDMTVFRRPLPDDETRRSPLSEQQLGGLIAAVTQVRVVLGSAATNVDTVVDIIRDATRHPVVPTTFRSAKPGRFGSVLGELVRDEKPGVHRILVADLVGATNEQAARVLRAAQDAIGRGDTNPRASMAIICVADSADLTFWTEVLHHSDPLVVGGVAELARWSDVAITVWGHHIDLPMESEEMIAAIRGATGGWPLLIDRLYTNLRAGTRLNDALAATEQWAGSEEGTAELIGAIGLRWGSPPAIVFNELVDLGNDFEVGEVTEYLREVDDLADVDVRATLQVLRALGVVEQYAGHEEGTERTLVRVEPVAADAWRKVR